MQHLLKRKGYYYFNRRVPSSMKLYDCRETVRIALKTDSHREAARLAFKHNEKLEDYWDNLIQTGQTFNKSDYEKATKHSQLFGFNYLTNNQLAKESIENIYARLLQVEKSNYNDQMMTSVLGGVEKPTLTLDAALDYFLEFSKGKNLNKSENQIRKWTHQRTRAMRYFISCIGNKDVSSLTRGDTLKFRDWWINKIEKEELLPLSANKSIIQVKTIVECVNDNLSLNVDTKNIFKKLLLDEGEENRRPSFTTEFIISTLLNPKNLSGLNDEAKNVLYAIAETGAGISEQTSLEPEDIQLDCEIPHIIIQPKRKLELKTKYRKRIIPLVGFALQAFQSYPKGFTSYFSKPDVLSATINKYLKENNLLPSNKHSVYSLRHSFQERLLTVNAPERIQADLMGHKFHRPLYGEGGSLATKYDWMKKIKLLNYEKR
ncbi:MAG: hypothetical protein QM737_09865 [Ferruginibacter sp.]